MHTDPLGASHSRRRFESPTLRLRAEWPALSAAPARTARHDFLVPNPRPDLSVVPCPRPQPAERPDFADPDSMFWTPASHAGAADSDRRPTAPFQSCDPR